MLPGMGSLGPLLWRREQPLVQVESVELPDRLRARLVGAQLMEARLRARLMARLRARLRVRLKSQMGARLPGERWVKRALGQRLGWECRLPARVGSPTSGWLHLPPRALAQLGQGLRRP